MTRKIADTNHVQEFHDLGIYQPTRTIELFSEIEEESAKRTIKNLHILDQKEGIITMFINSPGGSLYHGMAIYDAIKACKNHVKIVVYGEASSAASFILQAADERIISSNAYIMLHLGEQAFEGHPITFERWAKKFQDDNNWMQNVYLNKIKEKKPRFTNKMMEDLLKFDTIISAKDALDLNLVDGILGEEQQNVE